MHCRLHALFLAVVLLMIAPPARAQFTVEGDFRVRWYSDSFGETRDNRDKENYMRYLGRVRAKTKAGRSTTFNTELITLIDNPGSPVRNIAGTGAMRWGVSQLFVDLTEPDFLLFDLFRLRIGRQQFAVGNGLSFGESYYFLDKFDGARIDLSKDIFTLSLFGAITGQNVSATGVYPDPGNDQIYIARLGANVAKQDLMLYGILQRLRNPFNDSYIMGGGSSGEVVFKDLTYFAEFACQKFNVAPGLPKKHGIGYMAGVSYRWGLGPFRSIKVETRYAAYQGDNAATPELEQFSPPYPSFFWGSRSGYVNADIGGDYPHNGLSPEGSRIWYTRIYFIPAILPRLRLQFQYVKVGEYVNNDGINSLDNEFSARVYYGLSSQSQLQLRYSLVTPNAGDSDLDASGSITSSEDRMTVNSLMLEWQILF
jgi:hypothetical protein